MNRFFTTIFVTLLVLPLTLAAHAAPKNVIILIGDGMGYAHVEAASYYRFGTGQGQGYWDMQLLGMSTFSTNNETGYIPEAAWDDFDYVKESATDSAAAGTAISTGYKTANGRIGVDPENSQLPHIMDDAERMGKATGVVSTVHFAHATPASFVARNESRGNIEEIAHEMLWESKVDLIIGAGHPWFDESGKQVGGLVPRIFDTPLSYERVGGLESWQHLLTGKPAQDADGDGTPDAWNMVMSREQIQELATAENPGRVLGVLPVHSTIQSSRSGDPEANPYEVPMLQTTPTMKEIVAAALNVLSQDEDGFVLMAEGGAIDWVSHGNYSGRLIEEQVDFDLAAEYAIQWVEENSSWDETLLVITSDHECGYLTGIGSDPTLMPITNRGIGVEPGMEWHSGGHTNMLVPFFVQGAGTDALLEAKVGIDPRHGDYIDNTTLANVLRSLWAIN